MARVSCPRHHIAGSAPMRSVPGCSTTVGAPTPCRLPRSPFRTVRRRGGFPRTAPLGGCARTRERTQFGCVAHLSDSLGGGSGGGPSDQNAGGGAGRRGASGRASLPVMRVKPATRAGSVRWAYWARTSGPQLVELAAVRSTRAFDRPVGHDLGQSHAHRATEEQALDSPQYGAGRRRHEVRRAIAGAAPP